MIYRKSDTRPQKKVSESFQRSPDLQIKKGCCMMSPLSVQAKPRLFLATWDTCRFPLCERTNDAVNSTMARRGKRRTGTVSKSGCPRLAKVWKQSNKTKNPEGVGGEGNPVTHFRQNHSSAHACPLPSLSVPSLRGILYIGSYPLAVRSNSGGTLWPVVLRVCTPRYSLPRA